MTALIEAWTLRVGVTLACKSQGVAPRTWRHHQQKKRGELPSRPSRATGEPRRAHPAKLSDAEEQAVLDVLCEPRFVDVGVTEVYATLLDEGTYLCSESTMHRILREHGLSGQRRQSSARVGHPKPRVVATAPNMVWCWDISRLPGPHKGVWFYLYAIWDLWSRKTVGWCIDTTETARVAEQLIKRTVEREKVEPHQLVSHSDRGAQMIAGTITELYDTLGLRRSLSRPRVSNDNPHAEAGFKTLKYRPDWPDRFNTIEEAIVHCETFSTGITTNTTTPASGYSLPLTVTPATDKPSTKPAKAFSTRRTRTTPNGSPTATPDHQSNPPESGSTRPASATIKQTTRNTQNRQTTIDRLRNSPPTSPPGSTTGTTTPNRSSGPKPQTKYSTDSPATAQQSPTPNITTLQPDRTLELL